MAIIGSVFRVLRELCLLLVFSSFVEGGFICFLAVRFLRRARFLSLPKVALLFSCRFTRLLSDLLAFFSISAGVFLAFFSRGSVLCSSVREAFRC